MYQPSPVAGPVDEKVINDFEYARETVVAVRGIRQQKNIPPKEALGLKVKGGEFPAGISPLVERPNGAMLLLVSPAVPSQKNIFLSPA